MGHLLTAAGYLPKETGILAGQLTNGRPVDRTTVVRWIVSGLHGHRLAARRCGGRWYITRDDLERFLNAVERAAVTTR